MSALSNSSTVQVRGLLFFDSGAYKLVAKVHRLNVAVDDPLRMCGIEGDGHFDAEIQKSFHFNMDARKSPRGGFFLPGTPLR
jgi:hypothetical protein